MTNLINCGTCGYPLAPEERTTLVEKDGVMMKPAREWVGLADEDVYPLANEHLRYQPEDYEASGVYDLARAIETKLREKNHG